MRRYKKHLALTLAVIFSYQLLFPTISFALTGGPIQPEMQNFEPAGTSNMVDLFSGDFNYNIPLLDVGGYPLNLSYHSGITMDQEASWVGLGWNINPGVINRNVRGLPDDFYQENVTKEFNLLPNKTWGIDIGASIEVFGFGSLGMKSGIFKNNYKGYGMTLGVNPSISAGIPGKGSLTAGLGLNLNTQEGASVTGSTGLSFSSTANQADHSEREGTVGVSLGSAVNSRSGLKALSLNLRSGMKEPTKVKDKTSGSTFSSFSSTITFGTPTFTPTISIPMINNAVSFNADLGGELFGVHPDFNLRGYYSTQSLAQKILTLPAYGYFFSHYGSKNPYALLDFNREKDVPYTPDIKNLPVPNFTYDLLSVNGQGISGQFRAHRGDIGILFDHLSGTSSISSDLGVEIGGGNAVHGGFTTTRTIAKTMTSKWTSSNSMIPNADFQPEQKPTPLFEHFYFKNVGEKSVKDEYFQNLVADVSPLQVALYGNEAHALSHFNKFSNYNTSLGSHSVTQKLVRNNREKRGQLMSSLNTKEAENYGLDKTIDKYPINQSFYSATVYHDLRTNRSHHHMSEISVTNPDGKRYVFGIPAYNNKQREVSFAVQNPGPIPWDGQVSYTSGGSTPDNSTSNIRGRDNYFSAEQTPAYAHSYLLTGVLSPDYVDVNGDGISNDDRGEAVKLNYSKVNSNYKWRIPYKSNKANYNEGFRSDTQDDKANYLYGEKEIWYMHSVESKNMVVEFTLEKREDGMGVSGENGGPDTVQRLWRLSEINLYSKSDRLANNTNAIPIKTVHFVYDYSLCDSIDNSINNGGKLTLKEVYFTYGRNTQGRLNSYKFNYGYNPTYHIKRYDKWGNYQNNDSLGTGYPINTDFPYATQDSVKANLWATAWHMTSITLPSGGIINVDYEAKDYALVQNKRAMQMFFIKSVGLSSTNYSNSNTPTLYMNENVPYNYLIIDVPISVSSKDDIRKKYLDGIDKLYFRCYVDVDDKGSWEFVPGYCEIDDYGTTTSSTRIWIKLKTVQGQVGVQCNPIAKAAWQFIRLNLPEKAYPSSASSGNVISLVKSLIGVIGEIKDIVKGFDRRAVIKRYGKKIDCSKSWVRLVDPDYKKYGGGARVKRITTSDNWGAMAAGQSSFSYGQDYKYTTSRVIDGVTKEITSGVAAYEPLIGGDEIPLRKPLPYNIHNLLAPSNAMYTETPVGESLYPAPIIGYSKVTVSSINDQYVTRTKTGKTVHEFYTTYDFPVQNNYTDILLKKEKHRPVVGFLGNIRAKEFHTVSQGITVEVNDMHGKPKSESIYDGHGQPITSTRYHYKVEDENALHKKLVNTADIVKPDGTIVPSSTIGKDIDLWMDMRQQQTDVLGVNSDFNTETFVIPFFIPLWLLIPPMIPKSSSENTRFRSAVACKYIQKYGILERIEKIENGSRQEVKNLLYDSETGEVLMTETSNEFNDPIYNFIYPAHWAYDGMGLAYKNIGTSFSNIKIEDGVIKNLTNAHLYFSDGDEGYIGNYNQKIWITKLSGGRYGVIKEDGYPVNDNTSGNELLKILKSGRKNMASIPIALVTALDTPMTKITQASATEFDDQWRQRCEKTILFEYDTALVDTLDLSCFTQWLRSLHDAQVNGMDIYHEPIFADPNVNVNNIFTASGVTPCQVINGTDQSLMLYSPLDPNNNDSTPYYANFGTYLFKIESTLGSGLQIPLDTIELPSTNSCTPACVYMSSIGTDDTIAKVTISKILADTICDSIPNGIINPYRFGLKNNWHEKRKWAYYTEREPDSLTQNRVRTDGYFSNYTPAWNYDTTGFYTINTTSDANWVNTNEVTYINIRGADTENKDALKIYSSALYGYLETQPIAVTYNSQYRNTANDNYEDYYFSNHVYPSCRVDHWNFKDSINGISNEISDLYSHTGKHSLELSANTTISCFRDIVGIINDNDTAVIEVDSNHFETSHSCLPKFSPLPGKYVLSAWVKQGDLCPPNTPDNIDNKIEILLSDNFSIIPAIELHPEGLMIEGWQRYYEEFEIPVSYTGGYLINGITIRLSAGTQTTYFDDIRIYPVDAKMKTYVYDPVSVRLMAELDENNYATFYEYDDEGTVIRVKKETERGTMTLKENRSVHKK